MEKHKRYVNPSKHTPNGQPDSSSQFQYDEIKITYWTPIPELPQHQKSKPDQKKLFKKINDIKDKTNELKAERKEKKKMFKEQNKNIKEKIDELKGNIQLGQKCLVILEEDKTQYQNKLHNLQNKIEKNNQIIKSKTQNKQSKGKRIPLQKMNLQELKAEENSLMLEMSIQELNKRQSAKLNDKINQISLLKLEIKSNQDEYENDKPKKGIDQFIKDLGRLKDQQTKINAKLEQTLMKIECILQDINKFHQQIQAIQQQQVTKENYKIYEESKQIKANILAMRQNVAELQQEYSMKMKEYEEEQNKIKWIKWAQQVQDRKIQQRERQKFKQKKQKARQHEKGTQGNSKTFETKQKTYQKPKINLNQNLIDNCTFLINYCQQLNLGQQKKDTKSALNPNKQIELVKGEWESMQIIQPKKDKNVYVNISKSKKKKNQKQTQENEDKFSHAFETNQLFKQVKVLAPSCSEDLQSAISQLKEKQKYYLEHPNLQIEKKNNEEKGKYVEDKYNNTKRKNNKNIVNSDDFPTLY